MAMVATAGLAACAGYPEAEFRHDAVPQAVEETPFHPQSRYQCGPAALLTLLDHSGVDTSMASMVDRVYLPGREGSLQAELVAATRAEGRLPYRIDPDLDAVAAELGEGRPVLVLQNLGVGWAPRWHYAVVYATDPAAGVVRLRSGTDPERTTRVAVFLRTWARSGFWGMVVLKPGELPAQPDPARYVEAVAALEAAGQAALALPYWRAARARWPEARMPLFALGNAALAAGRPHEAASIYRELLARHPGDAAARNNFAHALAASGQLGAALAELETAL
ncbi:MAG TPA: PA2778 family cysteine peptidase, partial [Woeseiaceae bacterium]|nr:PA2778 family cysteine peptidase [Woeseiaceae bacterium]